MTTDPGPSTHRRAAPTQHRLTNGHIYCLIICLTLLAIVLLASILDGGTTC